MKEIKVKIFLVIAAFAINDCDELSIEPLASYAEVREIDTDECCCCEECFSDMCEECLNKLFPEPVDEICFMEEEDEENNPS